MTKEEVYDNEISPLMARIIELCKAHDIPILATFDLDDNRDDPNRTGLQCTTAVIPANGSRGMKRAKDVILASDDDFLALTVHSG